jgi:mRNA interferase YafQ
MLTYEFTGLFKKDLKLMEKRRKNMPRLREVMDMIIREKPLPKERRNHPLHGNWEGFSECHIQGDWLLIYRIDKGIVYFSRTGSHADLF